MRLLPVIVSSLLLCGVSSAQFSPVPFSARSASLGGIHAVDTVSRRISLSYRQGYAMSGLATRMLDAAWTLGNRGRIEAAYSHFGDAIYREHQAVLGYNLRLSDWLSAGIRGGYFCVSTGDAHYEAQQWLAAEAGIQAQLNESLTLYAEGGSRQWDRSKPWLARIGVEYHAVMGLTTVVELDSDEHTRLRAGVEYCYRRHYFLRTGLATRPLTLAFGFGARLGIYGIDLAIERHEYLGFTPQISLSVCP